MTKEVTSHKQILKATGIVGGAQIISILIRIVRTKIIAVLLGPAGVGIAGLYQSTIELVQSATSLGLGFSAVRDVAEAAGSGDQQRIGRTITILRRWVWLTGILGAAVLLIFHKEFSNYAFKDFAHAFDFVLLSAVPLFTALSGGQMAILHGKRKIGDMARAGVLGATAGLFITVPFYWLMGLAGIVPAIILTALAELGLSFYFARRISFPKVCIDWKETISGGTGMIKLGIFTVITGTAMTGSMYLVRIFIADKMGADSVGQFQAAWNLSATYVGLVLGAMATDYFPRLSAVNTDNAQVCKLVNEQTEIALLITGPLLIGMICFMDLIVTIFYSSQFKQSVDILLWQTLGNFLKVISWPMGFVLLAKGKGIYFIFTELLWNAIFIAIIWQCWNHFTLESTGLAFLGAYFVLTFVIFKICRSICNFSWSRKNIKLIYGFSILALAAFMNAKTQIISIWQLLNAGLFVLAILISFIELRKTIDLHNLFKSLLMRIGLR